uniref:NADH-ubiquinone oxidoreductase chain 4 n=1 Tax=Dactylogyrus lamellatus TaxID=231327 RepID=A0A342K3V4_9PLAT|nr:NADH dehydrogenase subunit 4 [Dactylogyrus lamellatus]ALP29098.1 NADH dehydrogenase subunit 4 [Dactylogyrus lamellatus]
MSYWLIAFLIIDTTFLFFLGNFHSFDTPAYFFDYFIIDAFSINLALISLVFMLVYFVLCHSTLGNLEILCLFCSIFSSIVCFFCNNILLFWVSYELTILPLLICLYVSSPYSERFLAGWYLLFYVLVTSLPLLILFFYNSFVNSSFIISECNNSMFLNVAMFILFITKVPLPPFHAWLPIVHAEASTFVSVVLSGYVMKLGVIGIFRFCGFLVGEISVALLFGFFIVLFFYLCSCSELDNKRWLAFLSLVHIIVAIVGFCYLGLNNSSFVTLFCLGHGLSAGLLFYLFNLCYNVTGTRNWVVIGLDNALSNFWRVSLIVGLLSVASFPPSLSFLSEVFILSSSFENGSVLFFMAAYIFLGGLIPVVLVSYLLINYSSFGVYANVSIGSYLIVFSLFLVWLLGVLAI